MTFADLREQMARARTPQDVYEIAVTAGAAAAGATAASVAVLDQSAEWVEVVAFRGYAEEVMARFQRMSADADIPLAEAIRAERTIVGDLTEVLAVYDGVQPTDVARGHRAMACVPIRAGAQVMGALGFSFDVSADDPRLDTDRLEKIASVCGEAISRTVPETAAGEVYREMLDLARGRLAFVSAATRELAKSLDRDAVIQTLTQLVVPRFADWASVLLPEGDDLVAATLVHRDLPIDDLRERAGRFRTGIASDTPSAEAFRSGRLLVAQGVDSDLEARIAAYPELGHHLAITRDRLVVPITFQDRILGVLTLGGTARAEFDQDDKAVAIELASRAGTALYNADRYAAERNTAEVLQRAVLPDDLPRVDGLAFGARYLPATETTKVGGDWYDAFPLRDGRIGLCVGDVVGHGVAAAACMGQLRNALRVYALDGGGTGEVVSQLNRFTLDTGVTNFATVVYGAYEPATGELEWTSAGHPPLAVLRVEGTEVLEARHGVPLGIMDQAYESSRTVLQSSECLLVYSDGLIERRGETLGEGLTRLQKALENHRSEPVDDFVERIIEDVAGAQRSDDVCALVVHRK